MSTFLRFPVFSAAAALSLPMGLCGQSAAYYFSSVAGSSGVSGYTDGSGTAARFNLPMGVAADSSGNLYIGDTGNHVVRKVTPAGVVSTLAGSAGVAGSADGTGSAARFNGPIGVAVDSAGNVYVADGVNHTLRKVTPAGTVTTLAGSAGLLGSADGTGSAARFNAPQQIAVDSGGTVFVADYGNNTVRKVTATGVVTTLAGTPGTAGSTDGTGAAARFSYLAAVAVDSSGNVFVTDQGNHTIRKITPGGVVTTFAGSPGVGGSADGTGAAARFNSPWAIAIDSAGTLFVTEQINQTVRRISAAGVVTTIGGLAGTAGSADGAGSLARFNWPRGLAVAPNASLYLADENNHTLRRAQVVAAPAITVQPQSQIVPAGGGVSFAVVASGVPEPSFQWRKGGVNIPGATAATYAIPGVAVQDGGGFDVVVTNAAGSATSSAASLTVTGATPDGFAYSSTGAGAVITGYSGSGGVVAIPSAIGGVPVSEIGANAFKDKTAVVGVSFPASLVRIGDSAFNGSGLTSVIVPGGVNAIGVYAFASCAGLVRAEVLDGVVSLGVGMFTNCANLAEAVLPLSLTTIQDGAFQYCYKLASVVIPPAVTTVNQYAFFGCSSLKSIVLPASLATIGNQVFKNCSSLVQVAFLGNAPTAGTAIFSGSLVSTVYFGAGRNGWAATFDTIPTAAMVSPAISAQPQSQTLAPGGSASFTVSVTGVPVPALQWYRNGVKIAGATGTALAVTSAQAADVGSYLAVLSNPQGQAVSSVARLSIPTLPFPVALGSGLVAHYPFDGNAQDRTSYAAHGTVKGATLTADRLGQANAAYNFSGSASTIEVPHAAQQNQLPFTISVWFRSSSPVGQSASADVVGLVGKYSSTSWNGWQLGLDEFNGTINPWYLPSRANNVIGDYDNRATFESAPFLADARWHQAVFTVDTTGGILYIDGVETARQGWLGSAVATASTYPMVMGAYVGNTSYYFKGDLDELRLYQRVLTATEVRDLFALEFSGVVPVLPVITTPPIAPPTPVGNSVNLCVSASGTAPLSYQWRKGGVSIAGATNSCFSIASAQTVDAGSYDCVVSNGAGGVTSPAAVLAVGSAPVITTQPVSQAVPLTSVVGFTVTATGTAPLSYQWRKNGVNFTGAVTASHVMNNLQATDAASYDVVVSNPFGSATSSAASLTLTPPVWFNVHPASQTVYAGASASFTSSAAGYNTSVTYQWRKDGVAITGATSASLSFSTIAPANAGSYDVIATSYAGSATSNAAVLTVSAVGPTITSQPQGATLAVGGGTTLNVAAVGALPMTFQWRRNGLDLAGATGSSLVLSNAQTYQAGDYTALVSNAYGTALSAAARINIIPRVVSYSARVMIEADGAVATFLIEGSLPKKVLLRAVGPGLAPFGLTGLPDPRLELFDRGANLLAVNDDWASTADVNGVVSTTAAAGAFALANGSKDAALVVTLQPGAYTVRALPASGPGGLAYLELYDVDLATGPMSTLPYVGVRGRLAAGGGVVVGGMGSNGRGQRSYLLRAVGPKLGISGALANPSMLVVREGVLVGQNDDWDAVATEAAAATAAVSRVAAFALPVGSRDAALALAGNLHAGPCTVQVGSGDTVGGFTLLELHDLDPARPVSFAPLVVSPPVRTEITVGTSASLRVLVHGSDPISYQWRKDGVPIAGATAASYAPPPDLSSGGNYSVVVSNALGSTTSLSAPFVVTAAGPASAVATHAVAGAAGYVAGFNLTITNTLSFTGTPTSLGWSATLPAGWSLVAQSGAVGDIKPAVGDSGTLDWAWSTIPASPVTFTYTVAVPPGASGNQQISAGAIIRISGELSRPPASPSPLVIPQILCHAADTDANYRISLLELTRVIELYNTRNGTTRTGCYAVATTSTEDGFAIDAARSASAVVTLSRYHSADSNRDGKLSLLELTRVIELYNYRSGTTRTGDYHVHAGSEDGFNPGPASLHPTL